MNTAEINASAASGTGTAEELKVVLIGIVGAAQVRDDQTTRTLYSQDIWGAGRETVGMVVAPRSVEEISRTVVAARNAGFAIAPRGGGMSYTGGYIAEAANTISLDMSNMAKVIRINADDMTVTVEAGCTWANLHAALKPVCVRTPFWGTMSGLAVTVGGGVSFLTSMLGSGHYGTASDSVVALKIVLGDGRVLRTGTLGADGDSPFFRHYGPDLAGLFCGDSGVFGIKAEITLRLIRSPAHEEYASFSFKTGRDMLSAMAEMARAGIASEMCAFDPGLTKVRMQRMSLLGDIKTLGAVIDKQKSFTKGLLEAGKIALAGRNFIANDDYPLHVIAEGRSATGVKEDMAEARRIAAANHGHEIANTIAKVIRAQPFPPLNAVLGPSGERWVPVHGFAPLSQTPALFDALDAVFKEMASDFERANVTVGYLFTSLSTNALIIEPVFYWPEARLPIHALAMEPDYIAKVPSLPENPVATAVVADARKRLIAVFQRFGCGHFQIGRTYPYKLSRDAASLDLIEAVKLAVDPAGILNPGALGLISVAAGTRI